MDTFNQLFDVWVGKIALITAAGAQYITGPNIFWLRFIRYTKVKRK